MASEQMQSIAAALRAVRTQAKPGATLAERRAGMEAMQAAIPIPQDVQVTDANVANRTVRWFIAPGARADRAILYFHGGGYVLGSLLSHRDLMARLSRTTRARVAGLDYRLAPEHPFPAALDDAVAAYRWLIESGFAPSNIMIAGDSAGGGLTLATLLALRDAGDTLPAGGILFSPWADLTSSGASITNRAAADPMTTPAMIEEFARLYLAATAPADPRVSPVFAGLDGLPPLLIQVGDAEILLDDATRIAANAKLAGVAYELQVWDEAFHVFQMFPQVPEAAEALAKAAAFFDAHTGAR